MRQTQESVFVLDVRWWLGDGHERFSTDDIEGAAMRLGMWGSVPRRVAGYLRSMGEGT